VDRNRARFEITKQGITTKEFGIVVEHYSWWWQA